MTHLKAVIAAVAFLTLCAVGLAAYSIATRANETRVRLDDQRLALGQQKDRIDFNRFAIHQTCLAVQNLNGLITATLVRTRHNLPRLVYYRQHPHELRDQRLEIAHELAVFHPRTCR